MAQLNDLLVLGNTSLIGDMNLSSNLIVAGLIEGKIKSTSISSNGTKYLLFSETTSGGVNLKLHEDVYYYYGGTYSSLNVGKTTTNGILTLWKSGLKTDIKSSATAARTITLPDKDGTLAMQTTWNDFMHSGNEFTFASPAYSGSIWFNYRTASGSTDGNITAYTFGNGKGGSAGVTVTAETFSGKLNGNSTGHSRYLETLYMDKSNWYGTSYRMYGWWETSSVCKLVVDGYQTKVDQAVKDADGNTISSTYLKRAGGTMTGDITLNNSNVNITRAGISQSWYQGRNSAMIKTTSYTGYDAILSMKTTAGDWALGVYNDNKLYFTYILDSNYNANTNTTTAQIRFDPDGTIAAPKFSGSGAGLTSLNASNISTGTLAAARLPNHASTSSTYGVGDSTKYGHVILYNAADCTSYTSDSGGACTPAAVKKAAQIFGGGGQGTFKAYIDSLKN